MFKWVSIVAAVLGIPLAFWAVMASTQPAPVLAPDESPLVNPFPRGLAAPGTIEAASRNIRVAAPEPGLIAKVLVQVNDLVKFGDPLFQLDPRPTESELTKAEAGVEISRRNLERLRAMPRAEDLTRLRGAGPGHDAIGTPPQGARPIPADSRSRCPERDGARGSGPGCGRGRCGSGRSTGRVEPAASRELGARPEGGRGDSPSRGGRGPGRAPTAGSPDGSVPDRRVDTEEVRGAG